MTRIVEKPGIKLRHGDALELLPQFGTFDAVITDPPYSSGARRDADKQVRGAMSRTSDPDWFSHDTMTSWGFGWFMRAVFVQARAQLSPGGHVYVFCDWRQTPNVYGILESCGLRVNHCLVWRKPAFGMGQHWRNQHENIVFASLGTAAPMLDRGMGSVLDAPNISPSRRYHPTEKPVALLQAIIRAIPSRRIIDPFMGVGSTGVAARSCGREFGGIEIREDYFEIARGRLAAETQQQLALGAE